MNFENKFLEKYKYYLLLIGLGFFVYFNGLFGAFVWDDIAQIQQNTLMQSLSNIPQLFLGGTYAPLNGISGTGTYYRPLMSLVFSLIYPMSGGQPFLFHFVQVLIHITNSILIFILFKKFVNEKFSFILALIFLVHPINVEAVSYISSLGEPLFVFFGLVALLFFQKENTLKHTIFVGFLLLCSLFAKETGIVFFVILFSYYLLFMSKKRQLLPVLCLTTTPLAIYLFMRFSLAKVHIENIPDVPMMTAPLAERLFTMPAIFWFYIKTFFFPKDLFILQLWSVQKGSGEFYITLLLSLLILTGVCMLGFWIKRTNKHSLPIFFFFTAWFLVGVGTHLQFIPLDFTVADRYFYFTMIGLLGMIGVSFINLKRIPQQINYFDITCLIIIIIALCIR